MKNSGARSAKSTLTGLVIPSNPTQYPHTKITLPRSLVSRRSTMVKSVIGEESQLKTLENRLYQSSVPAQVLSLPPPHQFKSSISLFNLISIVCSQVGIIIGKLNTNSDRGFVYDLIPTPLTDSGSPACSLKSEPASREEKKKGSKGGKPSNDPPTSLLIDGDWVAEHALQVTAIWLGFCGRI